MNPSTFPHVALWLDHHEARIFHVNLDGDDEHKVLAPQHHFHRHPKGNSEGHNHPDDQHRFFREITSALQGAQEILIGGPSTAKAQYHAYVHEHDAALDRKILKVEAVDHPTDAQFVAHARSVFKVSRPRV
jgi:hypothetical protein